MASAQPKDEFRNETKGFVGVVTIDPLGKEKGVAVRPGLTIWLSEAEQILTANAPRHDKDNPFTNGSLSLVTRAADVKNRRPIGDQAPSGAAPQEAAVEEVAPPADDAPAPPKVEGQSKTQPPPPKGAEGNQAPKPQTAAERAAAADKQATAGAKPVQPSPTEPSQSGTPKPRAEAPASA